MYSISDRENRIYIHTRMKCSYCMMSISYYIILILCNSLVIIHKWRAILQHAIIITHNRIIIRNNWAIMIHNVSVPMYHSINNIYVLCMCYVELHNKISIITAISYHIFSTYIIHFCHVFDDSVMLFLAWLMIVILMIGL